MKKIRVFVIGMTDHTGGIETYLNNLCSNLNKDRFDIIFNTPEMKINGKIWKRPANRHNIVRYVVFWTSFFHENRFDAIYFNTCDMLSIDMLKFAKRAGIPVRIIHSHCSNDNWKLSFIKKLMEKNSKKNLDKYATNLLACSKEAGQWMFGNRKFYIIKNGINLENFQFSEKIREIIRSSWKITLKEKVIICIGRIEKVKNIKFVIDVMCAFSKTTPDYKLLIVGEGTLKEELIEYTKRQRIDDHVIFTGARNDVNKLLSVADCLIMPSLFEGLPFTLVEAQASGLPCVVSSVVSKEANITGLVEYINLDESVDVWEKKIKEACQRQRIVTTQKMVQAGYSIEETAAVITKIIEGNM